MATDELLKGKNLTLYRNEELRQQALNTIAIESRNGGFRIAKEKASKKIDSTVALSMACVAALKRMNRPPLLFVGGRDEGAESVQQIQERADREAQEAATMSSAQIKHAVRSRGVWFPGDW
jgi:hypothetical protein